MRSVRKWKPEPCESGVSICTVALASAFMSAIGPTIRRHTRRLGCSRRYSARMAPFPALTHVALTVRDLSVSVPWYEQLLDAKPVLAEDTDPGFHHTVYLLGNTLLGLHQHTTPAPSGQFSE